MVAVKGKTSKSENLDYIYPAAMVAKKAVKTEKLLDFLSKQDPSFSLPELRKLAESTFRKLQECWEKRDYAPMEPLLMRALFLQHTVQLQGLARNHEINRIENLQVEKVDIVNLRYPEKNDQREFSALITASARDYYVDDRNQQISAGGSRVRPGSRSSGHFSARGTAGCCGRLNRPASPISSRRKISSRC